MSQLPPILELFSHRNKVAHPMHPGGAHTLRLAVSTSRLDTLLCSDSDTLALMQQLAAAGVSAIEICRASLPEGFREFRSLAKACKAHKLQVIYNTNDTLWDAGFISASLTTRLAEASILEADSIKFCLGNYPGKQAASWPQLIKHLRAHTHLSVMIKNDKSLSGGSLNPLKTCLVDANAMGYPLSMAFDIANWHWCGVDQTLAAKHLSTFVRHIDCKGLEQRCGKLTAISIDDTACRKLLAELAHLTTIVFDHPSQSPFLTTLTGLSCESTSPLPKVFTQRQAAYPLTTAEVQ